MEKIIHNEGFDFDPFPSPCRFYYNIINASIIITVFLYKTKIEVIISLLTSFMVNFRYVI